jgi:hypothetical protein
MSTNTPETTAGLTHQRAAGIDTAGAVSPATSDEWNAAFDDVLGSFKLRRPLAAPPLAPVSTSAVVNPSGLPFVFAFSGRRRMLHVYANAEEACRKADACEVEQHAWDFFDADGEPLVASFSIANAGPLWGQRGTFALAPLTHEEDVPRLRDHLDHVAVLHSDDGAGQFATVFDIRRHLTRVMGAGMH